MGYPDFNQKFSEKFKVEPNEPKAVDKTKLWYDGWQEDTRQQIFEENHYSAMDTQKGRPHGEIDDSRRNHTAVW